MDVMTRIRRAVIAGTVSAAAFTAASAFTTVTAQPAHADYYHCISYLVQSGYRINAGREYGCYEGAKIYKAGAWFTCYHYLTRSAVRSSTSSAACDRAAW